MAESGSIPKSPTRNLIFSLAACALSGVLLVACFPKIHLPGVVWIACLPLLAALAVEKSLKRAFLLGYVCGAFFFAGSCYWFTLVMEFYGHLSHSLAVVVLILFVIIDATFFGGFGLAMGWAARRSSRWALAASPFLWMAMELARTYLITGFPWNLLGYAVQASGVRQIATVTGVYGLSFLAVGTSALLAWALLPALVTGNQRREIGNRRLEAGNPKVETGNSGREDGHWEVGRSESARLAPKLGSQIFDFRKSLPALLALVVWVGLLLVAQWRLAPPPPVTGKETAILIQPNVPLDDAELESWAPWRDPTQLQKLVHFSETAVQEIQDSEFKIQETPERAIAKHQSQIANSSAEPVADGAVPPLPNPKSKIQNPLLLIWAENPAPFFFSGDPVFRTVMQNMARQTHAIVIANTIISLDPQGDAISNTAFTLDPAGREVSRYDKIHLVPFGEYVPWWALPGLVHKITSEVGNFIPGSNYPVSPSPAGGIGVFICYEAIVPQLARKLVANGAGVLVNISNDAWYGESAAAYQHLEMARLRAIENHRYLLRATNNGLTVEIDPYGRVLQELPRYQRAFMPAHFDFVTWQTFYSAHGDVFAWSCVAVAALLLAMAKARN
jgi:apolipoprotein N-acyltransferase